MNSNLDGLQCFWCDSSTDENCATLRLSPSERECEGNCAVWISGESTHRGCEDDIPEDTELFRNCSIPGCNKIIFPENRFKCVKCSAGDSFCTTPDADLLYPCRNYVEDDACYTYVIGKKRFYKKLPVEINFLIKRVRRVIRRSRLFI